MKCPVCDQENSAMLCPSCGFDASRDYEKYPTFSRIKASPSVSALRTQRQNAPKKTTPKNDGPRYVDYRQMVSQAAKEDAKKKTSQEHKLMLELQSARNQIETLKREQRILTDSVIPENKQLKERILLLANETKAQDMALREALHETAALKQENDGLKQNLGILRNRNNYLGQKKNELNHTNVELKSALEAAHRKNAELEAALEAAHRKNAELEAALEAAHRKNAELEAALEAERNKGILSRIFNR